jgi:hypothetical protein
MVVVGYQGGSPQSDGVKILRVRMKAERGPVDKRVLFTPD